MPDLCDAACQKIIINSRLIAYIARNLAEVCADRGHPFAQRARTLAAATRAACEAYRVAVEEGRLVITGPSGWNGCEEATFLMQLVTDIEAKKTVTIGAAKTRIDTLIDRANATTIRLVKE